MASDRLLGAVTVCLCWSTLSWSTWGAADDREQLRVRAEELATIGDVQVAVVSARVQRVGITAKRQRGQTKEEFLQVTIAITNRNGGKPLQYQGWGVEKHPDAKRAVVRDELGNQYRGLRFPGYEIGGQHYDEAIAPRRKLVDQLVFQTPLPEAKSFVLDLPGETVGMPDKQFEIVFRTTRTK